MAKWFSNPSKIHAEVGAIASNINQLRNQIDEAQLFRLRSIDEKLTAIVTQLETAVGGRIGQIAERTADEAATQTVQRLRAVAAIGEVPPKRAEPDQGRHKMAKWFSNPSKLHAEVGALASNINQLHNQIDEAQLFRLRSIDEKLTAIVTQLETAVDARMEQIAERIADEAATQTVQRLRIVAAIGEVPPKRGGQA
jgi:DNA-binding protein H-NS